jgi:putative membrane protein
MMWWDHGGWDGGDWFAMSVMMLGFWGLVAALVVWVVRSSPHVPSRPRSQPGSTTRSVDEMLAERLARGEIDETELARIRELLDASSTGSTPTKG